MTRHSKPMVHMPVFKVVENTPTITKYPLLVLQVEMRLKRYIPNSNDAEKMREEATTIAKSLNIAIEKVFAEMGIR